MNEQLLTESIFLFVCFLSIFCLLFLIFFLESLDQGILRGVAGHAMRLGICSRSNDVIEPMLRPQWYVDCSAMAAQACEVWL